MGAADVGALPKGKGSQEGRSAASVRTNKVAREIERGTEAKNGHRRVWGMLSKATRLS